MKTDWHTFFAREELIARQLRRSVTPDRARLLARELAIHPLGVDRGVSLLQQIGKPGSDDLTIVKAFALLAQLEPDAAPPIDMIRLLELRDLEGSCVKGVIFISTASAWYRTGNIRALAMLLHHEQYHATHPHDDETAVRAASRAFCQRHGFDTGIVTSEEGI
jgi:hypothetical protein